MVAYLWDQVRELRVQLTESEIQAATIEADVREEVVHEMQSYLDDVRTGYEKRLNEEVGRSWILFRDIN